MKDVIQARLTGYQCRSAEEEEHALKEITQEVVLFGLSKSGFFEHAHFHGGTCLRMIHGTRRFSEDLDFVLHEGANSFDIDEYLRRAAKVMDSFGYQMQISGQDEISAAVRKRFLKDDSMKKLITFRHTTDTRKKIKIKVEVDTHPPQGAQTEQAFLDFPTDFSLLVHDLSSLFAGKCHALLCRDYVKGRDWFDFSWYVAKRITPNYILLSSALNQQGPWKGQELSVEPSWLKAELGKTISTMNWKHAVEEISPFLRSDDRQTLELWGEDFFQSKVNKLAA